ncbi:unnamed protein product, partial [marine sediment metagenome]
EREFILVPSVESQPFRTDSIDVLFESVWVVATALRQEQHPEWKYVDIELGMVS